MTQKNNDGTRRFSQGLHGGEIYKAAASMGLKPGQILDFSSNSNIFARELSAGIMQSIPEAWLHYPEADAASLRKAVARHENIQTENLVLGNGAADLIWRFLQQSTPRSILFVGPAFSEYVRAAEALNIPYSVLTPPAENEFALGEPELRRLWESQAELVVLCTPNNPGGVTYENIAAVFAALRAPRILLDLSYRDFLAGSPLYAANHYNSYSKLRRQGSSVFCLHSCTKFYCCPGLRLGYLIGDPLQLRQLNAVMPSWTISGPAQEGGLRFLAAHEDYLKTLAPMRAAAYALGAELRRSAVFEPDLVLEGPNFFCCGLAENLPGALHAREAGTKKTAALQNFLLQHKILVRNCDNIPGMPPGFVRIQVRSPEDNEKLLYALEAASK